jgi:general stress protein 26
MKQPTTEQLLTIAKDVILATQYCFLITLGESGQINSRLMQPYEPAEDFTIYLGTSPRSRKISEIQGNKEVTLSYHSPRENAFVTLIGTCTLESDISLRKKFWREEWRIFFPGGADSDDYILIKFVPQRIEVMNLARNISLKPYGLRAATLVKMGDVWELQAD